MSDTSEVKRWEPCLKDSPAGTFVTVKQTRRVRDVFVKVEDHDRIVAELKAEVARQAKVIEKLKGMVSHYETCATVDRYDDEEVPCDCGLEIELAAIEKGEGT